MSTLATFAKFVPFRPKFKEQSGNKLIHWVYPILKQVSLNFRLATIVGQKLIFHLTSVHKEFLKNLIENFKLIKNTGKGHEERWLTLTKLSYFLKQNTNLLSLRKEIRQFPCAVREVTIENSKFVSLLKIWNKAPSMLDF